MKTAMLLIGSLLLAARIFFAPMGGEVVVTVTDVCLRPVEVDPKLELEVYNDLLVDKSVEVLDDGNVIASEELGPGENFFVEGDLNTLVRVVQLAD